MKATDAINKAKEHLSMFRPQTEGLRVETASLNEQNNLWIVVFSFYDDAAGLASAMLSQRNRVFKRITIDLEGDLMGIDDFK